MQQQLKQFLYLSRTIGNDGTVLTNRYGSVPNCRWLTDSDNCTIHCESTWINEINLLIPAIAGEVSVLGPPAKQNKISYLLFILKRHSCNTSGLSIVLLNTIFESSQIQSVALQTNESRYHCYNLTVMYSYPTELVLTEHAFAGSSFEYIKHLTFINVHIVEIGVSTFSNLYYVEHLILKHSLVQSFIYGSLNIIAYTLKCFEYAQLNYQSRNIQDITGHTSLFKLTDIVIRANLSNTLNATTFIGLTRVYSLILADCQIEYIGPNTFDPIFHTIGIIDLTHNKLKRLSSELFQPFIGNFSRGLFWLDGNPWHCDCDLISFGGIVKDTQQMFSGDLLCSTPNRFTHSMVASTDYCVDEDADRIENQKPSNRDMISMECTDYNTNNCEVVEMREQSKIKEVTTHSNGDLVIELDVVGAHNFVIIWFQTVLYSDGPDLFHYQASDTIDCLGSDSSTFLISNLTANHAYTICLVNKDETTISPFDCMPYYVRSDEVPDSDANIWILEEDKALVIGLLVGATILSVIFGLVLSFLLIRSNPTWLRGSKRVVRVSNTRSDVMVMPPEWRKSKTVPTKQDGVE